MHYSYCHSPKFVRFFHGIEKAWFVAELSDVKFHQNWRNPVQFSDLRFLLWKFGKSLNIWPYINYMTSYWAKLLHFIGFTNFNCDFLNIILFWAFLASVLFKKSQKMDQKGHISTFRGQIMAQISKYQISLNIICTNYKMQQLDQIWSPRNDYGTF